MYPVQSNQSNNLIRVYIGVIFGIMENKLEVTIWCLGFRVYGELGGLEFWHALRVAP